MTICACRSWRWAGTALITVFLLWAASSTVSGITPASIIPALGFSYQPNQYWRFDLVAPRPAITYFASRQLQLFVAGDFASDEYELKDRQSWRQGHKIQRLQGHGRDQLSSGIRQ